MVIKGPLSIEECIRENCIIVPNFFDDFFSGTMEYVSDVEASYKCEISKSNEAKFMPSKLPRIKSKEWGFQSEYRFCLWVLPKPKNMSDIEINQGGMMQAFFDSIDPGENYLDVPFNLSILDDLIIRTGPLCTAGGKICVQSLIDKFAPKAKIEESHLSIRDPN